MSWFKSVRVTRTNRKHFSLNHIRIRDVVAEDLSTFEIQKLELTKVGLREVKNDKKTGPVTRIECASEDVKDEWVNTFNVELKELRSMARSLSMESLFHKYY